MRKGQTNEGKVGLGLVWGWVGVLTACGSTPVFARAEATRTRNLVPVRADAAQAPHSAVLAVTAGGAACSSLLVHCESTVAGRNGPATAVYCESCVGRRIWTRCMELESYARLGIAGW